MRRMRVHHRPGALFTVATMASVVLVLAACDPGPSDSFVMLSSSESGEHTISLRDCDLITKVELAGEADLMADTELEFGVDTKMPFHLPIGAKGTAGAEPTSPQGVVVAEYLAQLEPPFTIWLSSDEGGMIAAYFEEWPEPGTAIQSTPSGFGLIVTPLDQVPEVKCSQP